MRVWDLSDVVSAPLAGIPPLPAEDAAPAQRQYTNAKVLLVGDSGVGKTGLARMPRT
jgi:MoxR-like ATPase